MTGIAAKANAHSHASQRRLRGRGERVAPGGRDDFWTWRGEMFALAGSLDPSTMHVLARETYDEMRSAGYGALGEFHYVHHQPDGTPYADPNEMAHAVAEAAVEAGLPIVLLPAAHSVRAVPAAWLGAIAEYADRHDLVRHVHAHEQRREVEQCQAEHGCSPIELLERIGFLEPRTSLIHGIRFDLRDVEILARTGTIVVTCPTTEGNLGDGHLPAMAYVRAGVPPAIGSDSQVRIDLDHRDLRGIDPDDLHLALVTCASAGVVRA